MKADERDDTPAASASEKINSSIETTATRKGLETAPTDEEDIESDYKKKDSGHEAAPTPLTGSNETSSSSSQTTTATSLPKEELPKSEEAKKSSADDNSNNDNSNNDNSNNDNSNNDNSNNDNSNNDNSNNDKTNHPAASSEVAASKNEETIGRTIYTTVILPEIPIEEEQAAPTHKDNKEDSNNVAVASTAAIASNAKESSSATTSLPVELPKKEEAKTASTIPTTSLPVELPKKEEAKTASTIPTTSLPVELPNKEEAKTASTIPTTSLPVELPNKEEAKTASTIPTTSLPVELPKKEEARTALTTQTSLPVELPKKEEAKTASNNQTNSDHAAGASATPAVNTKPTTTRAAATTATEATTKPTTTATFSCSLEEFTIHLGHRRLELQRGMVDHLKEMKRLQEAMAKLRSEFTSEMESFDSVRQSLRTLDNEELQGLQKRAKLLQWLADTNQDNKNTSSTNPLNLPQSIKDIAAQSIKDIASVGSFHNPAGGTATTTIVTLDDGKDTDKSENAPVASREPRLFTLNMPQVPQFGMESFDIYRQNNKNSNDADQDSHNVTTPSPKNGASSGKKNQMPPRKLVDVPAPDKKTLQAAAAAAAATTAAAAQRRNSNGGHGASSATTTPWDFFFCAANVVSGHS
ncbi:hypothetical protein ACA910_011935 [Epithemia clementina (nom. ined.)]